MSGRKFLHICLLWCAGVLAFPVSVWAAEGASRWGILEAIGRFFNLGVVVAVLCLVLRKPLGQFFEERRQSIRKDLHEAQQAYQDAQSKLAEMERRMGALDTELAQIKENAALAAEQERRRLLEQAEQDAERIVAAARRESESLVRAARLELREHAAKLAVELAEGKIRKQLGPEEERRLAEHFALRLGK